jgi:cytochrome c peroxidase
MKKLLVLFVLLLIGMSFRPDAPSPKENPSGKRMKESFRIYTNHLETNLEKIKEHIESESPPVVLRSEFKRAREDYKFLEAMVSHLFPSFDLDFNAKPVLELNTDAAIVELVEPHGLQVLEVALFRDKDYVKAKAEVEFMLGRLPELQKRIHRIQYQDRFAFEAVRQEVIRITALGITGFDSRVLKHSIPETIEALKSIQFLMEPYLDFMTRYNKNLVYDLRNRIYGAIEYCGRNSEFALFNRAEFIRDYMEPIYADIHQLHVEIGVETKDDLHQFVEPLNYEAKHMYSSELFDPYAFSEKSFAQKSPKIEELGALLFFDPVLSQNNKRACASCHNPTKGFADGLKKSPSINNVGTLKRNSPSLWNATYVHDYFWDLRSESLNDQFEHVTSSPLEFNISFDEILEKLRKSDEYGELFEQAFEREEGDEAISGTNLKQA